MNYYLMADELNKKGQVQLNFLPRRQEDTKKHELLKKEYLFGFKLQRQQ